MKSVIILLIIIAMTGGKGMATVLTVDNSSLNNAQYSSLSAAYSDAVDGDTIYLQPSDDN